ncbi:hypothetical protein Asppvi_009074 [Aspergillus pseudoviridinutans]|uniref:DUF6604 domain-containing protein n=1 Tax=Aspergillus pseudoviridinutans TaxID=1517512 RepID=A0A9P3BH54_9EURO|nr:uncharacterized protein Asppvi_009074 [Aspergillus pseudoviridinutans]GIJ90124.1 hypothetical protein Asppvi_009074 [Aspergillus pseudoviridinutans]
MALRNEPLVYLYRQYKESTKYALGWLYAVSQLAPANPLPRSDLLEAANRIALRKIEVPVSVISHLKSAVTGRRMVLQIYRSLSESSDGNIDEDNIKHETFINRLEEVLRILLPLKASSSLQSTEKSDSSPISNRFTALQVSDDSNAVEPNFEEENVQNVPHDAVHDSPAAIQSSQLPEDLILEDDDIGEWIELSYFLCVRSLTPRVLEKLISRQEMDAISEQVNECWRQAAGKQLPVPLAAWLSTTALHAAGRIFARISHIAPTFDVLVDKWSKHAKKGVKIRFKDIPQLASSFGGRCADVFTLRKIRLLLHHCRTLEEYKKILPNAGARANPADIIKPHIPRGPNDITWVHDNLALDSMQESMRQLLVSDRAIAAIEASEKDVHISEPLLSSLRLFLRDESLPIPFQLVYGMEMLLSTYKSFLWPQGKKTTQNRRILALQFAKEVQGSILDAVSALTGVQSTEDDAATIRHRLLLQVQADDLDTFVREQGFDLYYQSPWVAGCHMVEILDSAFFDGVSLCCDLGYVCAVLHLYNALRLLDPPIHKITLLEQLCQLFLQPLFLGTLPKENFCSHFRRARGQGRDREKTASSDRRSGLSMPYTMSKRKVDGNRLSLFHALNCVNYQPTIEFWTRVYIDPALRKPSRTQAARVTREIHSVPFSEPLGRIKTAVMKEFTGELPIMRTNLFAVFCFCSRLLLEESSVIEEVGDQRDELERVNVDGNMQITDIDDFRKIQCYEWRPAKGDETWIRLDDPRVLARYALEAEHLTLKIPPATCTLYDAGKRLPKRILRLSQVTWYRIISFRGLAASVCANSSLIHHHQISVDKFCDLMFREVATGYGDSNGARTSELRHAVDLHIRCKSRTKGGNPFASGWAPFHITWFSLVPDGQQGSFGSAWRSGPLYGWSSRIGPGRYHLQEMAFTMGYWPNNVNEIAGLKNRRKPLESIEPAHWHWTILHLAPSHFSQVSETSPRYVFENDGHIIPIGLIFEALMEAASSWDGVADHLATLITKGDALFDPNQHDANIREWDDFWKAQEPLLTAGARFISEFREDVVQYGDKIHQHVLTPSVGHPLAQVQEQISRLRSIQARLESLRDQLRTLRDGLFNASAVIESRAATELGENVKLLTYVSIVYLPLSFCAALWSIDFSYHLVVFTLVTVLLSTATYLIVMNVNNVARLSKGVYRRFRARIVQSMANDPNWVAVGEAFSQFRPERENVTPSEWKIVVFMVSRLWQWVRSPRLRTHTKGVSKPANV